MLISIVVTNGREIITYGLEENENKTGYYKIIATLFFVKDIKKLSKIIKEELIPKNEKGFGILAKDFIKVVYSLSDYGANNSIQDIQAVRSINSYKWLNRGCGRESTLSTLYLKGKTLPKIKGIKTINDDMYFVIKSKKSYDLFIIDINTIKCVIPLRNLISVCKNVKKYDSLLLPQKNMPKKKMDFTHLINKIRTQTVPTPTNRNMCHEVIASGRATCGTRRPTPEDPLAHGFSENDTVEVSRDAPIEYVVRGFNSETVEDIEVPIESPDRIVEEVPTQRPNREIITTLLPPTGHSRNLFNFEYSGPSFEITDASNT